MEYFHRFIERCTNIKLNTQTISVEENGIRLEQKFIRAGDYTQTREEYHKSFKELGQRFQNEISLLPDIQKVGIVNRLNGILIDYDKAWKAYFDHYERWYNGTFTAMSFEFDFFHLFNMKPHQHFAVDSPHFLDSLVSEAFFRDLSSILTDNQGEVQRLIYNISIEIDKETTLIHKPEKQYDYTTNWFVKSRFYALKCEDGVISTPQTMQEEWEHFKGYYAQRNFECQRFDLMELYGEELPIDIIKDELESINNFIKAALVVKVRDAFEHGDLAITLSNVERTQYIHIITSNDQKEEYVRLLNGYYSFKPGRRLNLYQHSLAVNVYAKYVLYKTWLQGQIVDPPVKEQVEAKILINDFDVLFGSEVVKEDIFKKMTDLKIIDSHGKYLLGKRKKSCLLAFAHALKDTGLIPQRSDEVYSHALADLLKIKRTKLKRDTYVYTDFYSVVISYLNSQVRALS